MGENFEFVAQGLANVKKGDGNRKEIHGIFLEFKNAISKACKSQHGKDVSFQNYRSLSVLSSALSLGMVGVPSERSNANNGDITVYLGGVSGLEILRYELDPVGGYPVTLRYCTRSVVCRDKRTLMATIKDAYNASVGDLKDFCENGSLRLSYALGLRRPWRGDLVLGGIGATSPLA